MERNCDGGRPRIRVFFKSGRTRWEKEEKEEKEEREHIEEIDCYGGGGEYSLYGYGGRGVATVRRERRGMPGKGFLKIFSQVDVLSSVGVCCVINLFLGGETKTGF